LKLYTQYVSNFETASSTLEACEKVATFDAFLKEKFADPACRGQSLRSFLILPVQRIPRYRLLLEDLMKNTDSRHPDYKSISDSLETIKVVATQINEAVRIQENRQKILSIQLRINSLMCNINLVEAHRLFIREGTLWKLCRKASKKREFFLFNDLLIYASILPTNGILVHRVIQLEELRIQDIPDTDEYKNAFQIGSLKKSFVVWAETVNEKVDWLLDITNAAAELKRKNETLRRARQTSTVTEADEAPVWQPDSAAKACTLCPQEFSLLNRRHHCRSCGKVVCGNCSTHRLILPSDPSKARVCDACFKEWEEFNQTKAS
jgi:FYVE/RhoGEF/PH domain-containing protein 5/6